MRPRRNSRSARRPDRSTPTTAAIDSTPRSDVATDCPTEYWWRTKITPKVSTPDTKK